MDRPASDSVVKQKLDLQVAKRERGQDRLPTP
jgi:hypothetical protein